MPTLDINSRAVLIVRLICHDEKVYEETYFAQQVSIKVNYTFLHKIPGLAQNLPIGNNQPFYQEEIKPMGFFPSFSFQFYYDQTTSTKVTSMLPEIAPEMRPSMKKNI